MLGLNNSLDPKSVNFLESNPLYKLQFINVLFKSVCVGGGGVQIVPILQGPA